jgi:hypothetical protein
MKIMFFLCLLYLAILTGCSGSNQDADDLNLKIKTQQMNSWVNLMPGSKPSFFISGSIQIKNTENSATDSLMLLKCDVLQDDQIIYQLHPGFHKSVDISSRLKSGEEGIFTINLSPGAPINKELNLEKPVSISLYLSALNKVIVHKIDSIYIIKTY